MKRKNIFRFITLSLLGGGVFGLLVVLVGCASIIHGSRQNIAVNSSPTGVKVYVKGVHMATTPSVIELRRKDTNVVLRFEKEGYEPVEVVLKRTTDGWIWGNIAFGLLGAPIGLAIDFANGSAYKLTPTEVNAVMERAKLSKNKLSKDGIVVAVDMERLRGKGIR